MTSRRLALAALVATCACDSMGTEDPPPEPPATGPDLVVSIRRAPDRVSYGRDLGLHVTVLNRGTELARRTELLFLHSADQTITRGDDVVRSLVTDSIPVDGVFDIGVTVDPPRGEVGTMYYGACVVPLATELDTGNNCSEAAGVEIFLATPRGKVVARTHASLTSDIAGGGGQTSFRISRRHTGGIFALVMDLPAADEDASYTDTGLEPNTVYYYKTVACNGGVCSEESDEWGGLTEVVGPVAIPAVPMVMGQKVNISFGTDKARVLWDAVPGATYYRVYQGERLEAEVSAPAESYYDNHPNTSLGAFQTTRYKVRACNKAGCSDDSETVVVRYST